MHKHGFAELQASNSGWQSDPDSIATCKIYPRVIIRLIGIGMDNYLYILMGMGVGAGADTLVLTPPHIHIIYIYIYISL